MRRAPSMLLLLLLPWRSVARARNSSSTGLSNDDCAGLYKGLIPNILKLAPAAGVSWYVFEETKRWLGLDPRV